MDAVVAPIPDPSRSQAIARWGWAAGFALTYGLWLMWADRRPAALATTNFGSVVGPLVILVASLPLIVRLPWGRIGHRAERRRLAGLALVAAVLGLEGGQVVWSYYECVAGRATPFPSLADVFYLAGYVATFFGLMLLPVGGRTRLARGRTLLDVLTTIVAFATFSWYFLLAPILTSAHGSPFAKALSVAYPLLDLTLLLFVLLLNGGVGRGTPGMSPVFRPLFAACIVVFFTDAAFVYGTLHDDWKTGSIVELGWPVASMLIAIASWHLLCRPHPDDERRVERMSSRVVAFLPYAFLLPTLGLVYVIVREDRWTAAAIGGCVGAALLVLLILVRQAVVLVKNELLCRQLQSACDEAARHHEEIAYANDALGIANAQLAEANERLQSLATTDGMTGLANHRAFQERLRAEVARSARTGQPFALLLIDVDHFKSLNDAFGHPAGDEVLRLIASLIRRSVREVDVPARYGGEEFAVICPGTTIDGIAVVADRIRATIAAYAFPRRPMTVSIGVACTHTAGVDANALITAADAALYASKRSGRNCVTHATKSREAPLVASISS